MFKAQCGSRCVLRCSRLNAALVGMKINVAIVQKFHDKSSKLKLSYRRSISVLTSVLKLPNWHRFTGWVVLWCCEFEVH